MFAVGNAKTISFFVFALELKARIIHINEYRNY